MRGIVQRPRVASECTVSSSSVTMTPETIVQRVPFTYDGDGTIEAFANNDNVKVKLDGRDIVLTAANTGTAQVTLRATGGVRSKPAVATPIDVTLSSIPTPVLANNSWDLIQRTIHAGYGKQFWTPGDKVPRHLEGTVGVADVTGDYYDVLLDIDHNPEYEGAHNAQFGLAWYADDETTPIAFTDEKYNTAYYTDGDDFRMNITYKDLTAGWSEMQLRRVIQSFFAAIQDAELKKVMVAGPKYRDDGIFIANGVSDPKDVREFRDVIWIPSSPEFFGRASGSQPRSEEPFNAKFPIFVNDASRIAYSYTDHAKPVYYWTSSRSTSNAGIFRCVYTSGAFGSSVAYGAYGVRPCYTIS